MKYSFFLFLFFVLFLNHVLIAQDQIKILVLYHSNTGNTYKMARAVARGIEKQINTKAVIKQVLGSKAINDSIVTVEELPLYDGIAFGSPVYFGNISTEMHQFLAQTISLWDTQELAGKPATVFMAAGSGAGREMAIISFWSMLASHGMILVPMGMQGGSKINKNIPQGNTPYGVTTLTNQLGENRPSESELKLAELQGELLARIARKMQHSIVKENKNIEKNMNTIDQRLEKLKIKLPEMPNPVGNYKPFTIANNLVYINQIGLKNGQPQYIGTIGKEVSEEQAKENTRTTLLNIIAVLKQACGGDWSKVKQSVQLTGFFNTQSGYKNHSILLNEASDLLVEIFGEQGKHARAAVGASSLPLDVPVEIQAIFELY